MFFGYSYECTASRMWKSWGRGLYRVLTKETDIIKRQEKGILASSTARYQLGILASSGINLVY